MSTNFTGTRNTKVMTFMAKAEADKNDMAVILKSLLLTRYMVRATIQTLSFSYFFGRMLLFIPARFWFLDSRRKGI
jgi:hypothetical protein